MIYSDTNIRKFIGRLSRDLFGVQENRRSERIHPKVNELSSFQILLTSLLFQELEE